MSGAVLPSMLMSWRAVPKFHLELLGAPVILQPLTLREEDHLLRGELQTPVVVGRFKIVGDGLPTFPETAAGVHDRRAWWAALDAAAALLPVTHGPSFAAELAATLGGDAPAFLALITPRSSAP